MRFTLWYIVIGLMLVGMALASTVLRRLPLSVGMLYLLLGVAIGPAAFGLVDINPITEAELLERLTEAVVIVSLFAAGLKLRTPLLDRRWVVPVALAFGSMAITVGAITLVGWSLLGLPLGAAVLLGAVLAPTDPVLASDVQVEHPTDQDRVRFSLTGEAGLNDGTAFPFVMLGLGLLGLHDLGAGGWRWVAVDVVWAILGGLAIGTLLGTMVGRLVIHLRAAHREALGTDDFLALGLIALSYGGALLAHTYGFLAVFAAGLALRRVERNAAPGDAPPADVQDTAAQQEAEAVATDADTAPAYMAQAVLGFSEQLERIGTLGVVLVIGAVLLPGNWNPDVLWFAPLLLLVIRPLAVAPAVFWNCPLDRTQRLLIAWFGMRGIGSVYYLAYALVHGVPIELARTLVELTFWTIAISVGVHGVSVTPLMSAYSRRRERRGGEHPG